MNVRKIFVIASAAIAVLLSSVGVYAQEFTVPPVVEMQRRHYTAVFGDTDMAGDPVQPPFIMPAGFRIWGWSQNGLVAYSTQGVFVPEAAYHHTTFKVVNIVRDEVVFEATYNERESPLGGSLFNAISNRIVQVMEHYNIIAHNAIEPQVEFLPFPIRRGGIVFDVRIEGEGSGRSVIMDRNGRQSKTIKTSGDDTSGYIWRNVRVAGYFMSPFENRALVVLINDIGACKDDWRIILSGAHLGTGFR